MKGVAMPTRKKNIKKHQSHEMIDTKTEDLMGEPFQNEESTSGRGMGRRAGIFVIVLLVLFISGLLVKKGYIVAAVVNGRPIFRWELNNALLGRYGTQTLESMITEKLIDDAMKKDGIEVTKEDVDKKIETIMQTLGPSVNLDELLKYQGMTKSDFEQQVRLQLAVEKVLSRDVTIVDKDIDDFIATNKKTMTATGEAELRQEARATILSGKISEKIQPWLAELKEKAKVTKFLSQ